MRGNLLRAVTCVSASECWAVGTYYTGSAYQTLIQRWDGTSWAIVASPNTSLTQSNYLKSVTCATTSDCWAAGYYIAANGVSQTLIERWDGISWAIIVSPSTLPTRNNYLNAVTCVSASDCWAAGFAISSSSSESGTLVERWNGFAWAIVTSPNTSDTESNILNGVTCASGSDCWAVGYHYGVGIALLTLIERWNGISWAIVASPNSLPVENAQNNFLQGVTCVSTSNCWAAGYYSTPAIATRTLVERWDGTSWGLVNSDNTDATHSNYLFGTKCVSGLECWAVGYYYSGGTAQTGVNQTVIERWDGNSWTIVTSPNSSATQNNTLYDVACASASECWAVGYYVNASGVNQTLTERFALPPVQLNAVVSRKTHGSAGDFDIDLPLTGNPGIECRSGGANGNHTLVFSFVNALTSVGGANVTSGTGSINSSNIDSNDAHKYVVNLTGVTNAQVITVSLTNVQDSTGNSSSAISASMGVLIGDTNADRFVNSGDIAQTKSQSGQSVTSSNFREDVTVDGNLNSGDIGLVKSKSGTALP